MRMEEKRVRSYFHLSSFLHGVKGEIRDADLTPHFCSLRSILCIPYQALERLKGSDRVPQGSAPPPPLLCLSDHRPAG